MYVCTYSCMYAHIYQSIALMFVVFSTVCMYVLTVPVRRSTGTCTAKYECTCLRTYICQSVCFLVTETHIYATCLLVWCYSHPIPSWTLWRKHQSDRRQVYVTISIVRQASLEHTSSWGTPTHYLIACTRCDDVNQIEILHRPVMDTLDLYLKGCIHFLTQSVTDVDALYFVSNSDCTLKQGENREFQANANH